MVGSVEALWRYPVKSMMGESPSSLAVAERGVVGDRWWATRDEVRGGIRGAKKIGGLMTLAARFVDDPVAGDVPTGASVPVVEIDGPDGSVRSDDEDVHARLSGWLDHEVTLCPLMPADDLDHYVRGAPDNADILEEARDLFAREGDEPLPDLSGMPQEVWVYESPPGTYYDAFPVHLLTTSTLRHLSELAPDSTIDARRFRPNVLLDTDTDGFVEREWVGRRVRIGGVTLDVASACPRCVMITRGFADVPQDRGLMRTVVREAAGDVGVYATVVDPGTIDVGDPVELLD